MIRSFLYVVGSKSKFLLFEISGEMGFVEQHVEEKEKWDAEHHRRWDMGLEYMASQEKVVNEFEGAEQEESLSDLPFR